MLYIYLLIRRFAPSPCRSTTNTVTSYEFSVKIHKEREAVRDAIFGDQLNVISKLLYQEVFEDEDVVYWSFMADSVKCCDLVLKLFVES